MAAVEVSLEVVVASARIGYIEEQIGAEPILLAGVEHEVTVADIDNSNCPPGNFEDPAGYCARSVQEQSEGLLCHLVVRDEPSAPEQLDSQHAAQVDHQVLQTQPMHSLSLAAESAEQLVALMASAESAEKPAVSVASAELVAQPVGRGVFVELAAQPAALAVFAESAVAGLDQWHVEEVRK